MKRCFIFAAGTYYGLRERPQTGDLVLAADAGYLACRQAGITPDLLLGDFDSMDQPADLDHTLANLQTLLYLRRHGARGYLYDNDFVWTAVENETITVEQTVEWGLLSVFCLGAPASGIDEKGVQYPLSHASLSAEFPLGVSNHIIEPKARITVRKGALIVGWELPSGGVVSEIK